MTRHASAMASRWRQRTRMQQACICMLWVALLASRDAASTDKAAFDPHDTIIARASEARQADSGDIIVFSGDLQLRGSLWRINADRARVEGKLEDPDLIVVDGDPARIVVGASDAQEPVEGRCQHLEFEPHSETLRLEGGAMVVKGQQSISSESIKYLVKRNNFTAGSVGRVTVVTKPQHK